MINNKTQQRKTVIGRRLLVVSEQNGQSLIEVIIALAIGAILIGAAALGIAFVLRSTTASERLRLATEFTQETIDRVRSLSLANWQTIYGLTKGTNMTYFVTNVGSGLSVLQGREGVFGNDIFEGLVGYWKMDESSGVITHDASLSGNDGTIIGGITRATSTCKAGNCLRFPGAAEVSLTTTVDLAED